MYRVREQIGCGDIVQAGGGRKVAVAILDTGVARHPDLVDRILGFRDFINGKDAPYDDSGHGTHVCGIACGSGLLSDGRYRGIAPKAGLVVGKILDEKGDGSVEAMLEAIGWVIQKKEEWGIRILNVSVGVGQLMSGEKEEILKNKLESAWQKGLLVVCAAGNNGPSCDSLSSIGKSPFLITVGCHDGEYFKEKENRCAAYSARGTMFGSLKKPDIVAPGTEIIACNGRFRRIRGTYANAYIAKSGTSMATPIVSGALALLLQKHPEYDNETAKRKLLYSADDLGEPWYQQGWGMINVARMME
ncbi:MAG: S8 family peptidase [Lachnospiraceae bacterium]